MSAGRGALSRPSPAGRPLTVLELGLGLGTEPAAAILTQPSLLLCQQGCRLCRDGAPGPPGCARTGATSTRRAGAPLPPPPSTLGEAGRAAPGTHLGAAARGARLPRAHHHQRVLVLLTLVCHTPVPRVRPGLARLPGGPGPRGERPSPRRPPPAATGTASVLPQPAASRECTGPRPGACRAMAAPRGPRCPRTWPAQPPAAWLVPPQAGVGMALSRGGGLGLLGRPAGPAQDPPPGCEAPGRRHCCTHLEEAHGAVTAVRDAGHLHAPPAALPVQRPVLKALWGRGGVRPEAWPALLGARHGRGGGCSPRGSRCCRSGSHS